MIEIKNGDILSCECDIICQQVNCWGVMGSGLAKQIRDVYPDVYDVYMGMCKHQSPYNLLGEVSFVQVRHDPKRIFANIFGQLNYGRGKGLYTNYDALEHGIKTVAEYANEHNFSVAIPYNIGCGLANGDWNEVYDRIRTVFAGYPSVQVEIWRLK